MQNSLFSALSTEYGTLYGSVGLCHRRVTCFFYGKCEFKRRLFTPVFYCPQCFDLSDKKALTYETIPLSVMPLNIRSQAARIR